MTFPKAPNRPITGGLKLYISPPVVEELSSEGPDTPDLGSDQSTILNISPPLGFSMDTTFVDFIERQKVAAHERLKGLQAKIDTCRHCRKVTDSAAVELAGDVVEYISSFLKKENLNKVSFGVGHLPGGAITISMTCGERDLGMVIHQGNIEITSMVKGKVKSEMDTRLLSVQLDDELSWCVEK